MRVFEKLAGVLLLFALACGCTGSSVKAEKKPITSIQQLNDPAYTVSVSDSGAAFEAVKRDIPRAKRVHFDGTQGYDGVRLGKFDAYAFDRRQMEIAIAHGLKGLRILPGHIGEPVEIAVGLSRASKFPNLRERINKFIAELKADGTLEDMYNRWVIKSNYDMPDIDVPENANLTLNVGTIGLIPPYSYYEGNKLTGYDVELARRFAKWLGASVKFGIYDYGGVIAAAATGEIDCIMANLNITPERAEKIDYSDVLFTEEVALIVRDDTPAQESRVSSSLQAFDGKRIGVFTGHIHDKTVQAVLPNAKLSYFEALANGVSALTSGKVDALVVDDSIVLTIEQENPNLTHIDEYLSTFDNAFIFTKSPEGDKFRNEFNDFLRTLKADGTLTQISALWSGSDDSVKTLPDYENYPATNGTLDAALDSETPPFAYIKDWRLVGYDIDIFVRFCKAKGYKPKFSSMNFSGVLPAVVSGKCVAGIGAITITPERAESVNFSESVYSGGALLLVRKSPNEMRPADSHGSYTSIEDLDGKRIGVLTGSIGAEILKGKLPAAKAIYIDNYANMVNDLNAGKIDAILEDDFIVLGLEHENPSFKHIDGYLRTFDKAFIFTKSHEGDKLRSEFNEFLRTLKADGTLKQISDVWTGFDESRKTLPEYEKYPAISGRIKFAVDNTTPTFSYVKDGRIVGYDVDILARFCRMYGYRPEPVPMNFSGELPAVQSGRCLVGISAIAITPERAESVNFSEPVYSGGAMLLVKKSANGLKAADTPAKYRRIADLNGKRIGVPVGATKWEAMVRELLPDSTVSYYNGTIDFAAALEAKKIDAFLSEAPMVEALMSQNKNVDAIDEVLNTTFRAGIALPKTDKGRKLLAQWDEYITSMQESGKLDAMLKKWTGSDEAAKTIADYESFPAPNGVLVTATDGTAVPYSYYKDGKLAGFQVDLAVSFCEAYGYGLEFKIAEFRGILAMIKTGKCDFGVASMEITDERAEQLLFSKPYYNFTAKMVVRADEVEHSPVPVPAEAPKSGGKFAHISDLNGKRIGVDISSMIALKAIREQLPDSPITYYSAVPDFVAALESRKIDAFPSDVTIIDALKAQHKNIAVIDEVLTADRGAGIAFAKTDKGRKLQAQWNEYITSMKESGKLDAMMQKWTGSDESAKTIPDYESFPAPNGVLITATNGTAAPYSYYKDGKLAGSEIDLAAGFCEAYGYGLKFIITEFSGILAAINSGKCDFGVASMEITDERAEQMLFSKPYYQAASKMVVRAEDLAPVPAPVPAETPKSGGKFVHISDLNGKRIGADASMEEWTTYIRKQCPDSPLSYYTSLPDFVAALESKKIDAFPCEVPMLDALMSQNKNVGMIDEVLATANEAGIVLPKTEKGRKLQSQWNEYITSMKDSGKLDAMMKKWTGLDESAKTIADYESFPAPNGVLTTATNGTAVPYSYYKDGKLAGFQVDLAVSFCETYGYGLEFKIIEFGAIVAAVQSGKCDFGVASMEITEERAEQLLFSTPYYKFAAKMAVRAEDLAPATIHIHAEAPKRRGKYTRLAELNGKKIGVFTGVDEWERIIRKHLPDSPLVYYNTDADSIIALQGGKIEAFPVDSPVLSIIMAENDNITALPEYLGDTFKVAVALAKNDKGHKLKAEWDDFLTSIKNDGRLDALVNKWINSPTEEKAPVEYESLPAIKGVLVIATDAESPPLTYYNGDKLAGLEIELAAMFCKAAGYGLDIRVMIYDSILPGIVSGKYDCGLATFVVTEEHEENVLFSLPYYEGSTMMAILADESQPAPAPVPVEAPKRRGKYTTLAELNGKKIGVSSAVDEWVKIVHKYLPDSPQVYYNTIADFVAALEGGKIEAFPIDSPVLSLIMAENENITVLPEPIGEGFDAGVAFAKNDNGYKLKAEWDDFITSIKADGRLDALVNKWSTYPAEKNASVEYESLPAINGELVMATDAAYPPLSFYEDSKLTGLEVELAAMFCKAAGYALTIRAMNYDAIFPAISSGKYDFALAGLSVTDEHAESVLFSIPYYSCSTVMAILVDKSQPLPAPVNPEASKRNGKYTTLAELNGKKIGVLSAVDEWVQIIRKRLPELLDDSFDAVVAFAKNDDGHKLKAEWDDFLTSIKADGRLDALVNKWAAYPAEKKAPVEYESLPAINGERVMAANEDNRLAGLEIELAAMFCKAAGYGLKIRAMNYDAIFPAISSGKYDFALAGLGVTDEHAESVLFSTPYYACSTVMAIPADKSQSSPAPEKLASSSTAGCSLWDSFFNLLQPAPAFAAERARFMTLEDFAGTRIGAQTGTINPQIAAKAVPSAKIEEFNDFTDILIALRMGKIDAACLALNAARFALLSNEDLTTLDEPLAEYDAAPIFAKTDAGRRLCEQYNEFIRARWEDGTIKQLDSKWFSRDESKRVMKDYTALPAPNGTLKMAVDLTLAPFAYVKDSKIVGYEVELAEMFCEANGYGLQVVPMSFGAVVPAVMSGKCDFASCTIAITPERAESVQFGIPNAKTGCVIVVRKSDTAAETAPEFTSLAGKRIGVTTGTTHPQIVAKYLPTARLVYFENFADVLTALNAGRVDAICAAIPTEGMAIIDDDNFQFLGEPLTQVECAPIFPKTEKGQKLCEQFSEFAKACWDNNTIQELAYIWFSSGESRHTIKDYSRLPSPNGTLKVAAYNTIPPFIYVKDNRIVGYDVDTVVRFCEAYGYGLELVPMNFGGIIPAVQSGKCDLAIGAITITEERAENVLFSYPTVKARNILVVRKSEAQAPSSRAKLSKISDLSGRRIGVTTGTTHEQITRQYVPDAKIVYFNNNADTLAALKANKIDAACTGTLILREMMTHDDSITSLGEQLTFTEGAPMFPKTEQGQRLCGQVSEFAKACWEDGTIKQLESMWFDQEDSKRTLKDYSALPSPNGTLRVAVNEIIPPCVYMKDNRIVGYDVDFMVRFCEAYGYGLKVVPMSFAAIIPALNAGKCDLGIGAITITDERKESVLFSYPNLKAGNVFAVRKSDVASTAPAPVQKAPAKSAKFMSIQDLAGKRIAVQTGTNHPQILAEFLPTAQLVYFENQADLAAALNANKVDAFCTDIPVAEFMISGYNSMTQLGDKLTNIENAPMFPKTEKGRKLCEEYSEFTRAAWENGTIHELESIWFGGDDSKRVVKDYSQLPAPNGRLRMAVDTTIVPFTYVKDNKIAGYCVDFAVRFCETHGYGLDIIPISVAAVIPALMAGKCDFADSSFTITEERAENVLFSYPNVITGTGLFVKKADTQPKAPAVRADIQVLAGKRIAVQVGMIHDKITADVLPTSQLVYFDSQSDLVTALRTNKVDAFCTDIPIGKFMSSSYSEISQLGDDLTIMECAPIFPKTEKGRRLCEQFTEFTNAAWEDGTIQELESIWFGHDDSKRVVKDYSQLPAPNGKLRMASDPSVVPFVYVKGNRLVGYDVDFAVRFCEKYGYGLEVVPMHFAAVIPALQAGRCDFGANSITITEERAESVLFAAPNLKSGTGLFVKKPETVPQAPAAHADVQAFAGKRIAVQTGMVHDKIIADLLPTAKLVYFENQADLVTALHTNKVDAFCSAIPVGKFITASYSDITQFGDTLRVFECAPIFPKTEKGRKLCGEFSEFVQAAWKDGTIHELESIWFGSDDSKRVEKDYSQLPAPNGTLKMAVEPSLPPFVYMKNNRLVGYEVDCAAKFCERYGYGLEVVPMNFAAIIPELLAGRCDFGASAFGFTEERAESVLFAAPNLKIGTGLFVKQPDTSPKAPADFSSLAGKRIGVQTGTTHPQIAAQFVPTAELVYFDSTADVFTALKAGKIDVVCTNTPIARFAMIEDDRITMLGDELVTMDCSPVFPKTAKGEKLRAQVSEFVKACRENGTLQELDSIWFGRDDSKRVVKDYTKFPATNGTLRMATDTTLVPFAYVKNNRIVGYDVDFAARFCEAYGYRLEVVPMAFGAIIPALQSGRCDFAECSIAYTDERAENVLYAESNLKSGYAFFVRKPDVQHSDHLAGLAGKHIGVVTGTNNPALVEEFIPTAELKYFDNNADLLTALRLGKVDAVCMGLPTARFMMIDHDDVTVMNQLAETDTAPIFAKTPAGRKLCEQYSEFIKPLWDNGTIQEIDSIWFGRDESKKVVKDYSKLPAPNGVLEMAVDTALAPFAYIKNNEIVGYDVDLAVRFCEAYGYGLKIEPMDFNAIIPAVLSGKCDFASCTISVTEERKENVLFSYPNAKAGNVIVVRKSDAQPSVEIADWAGKRIGVRTGTNADTVLAQFIPEARCVYFDTVTDIITALKTGKIDAMCTGLHVARYVMLEQKDIAIAGEPLTTFEAAPIFAKTPAGKKLCEQFSEFIKAAWDNGTIAEIDALWFSTDEAKKVVKDYTKFPAPNGTLKMAVDPSTIPFVFMKDGKFVGYEVDIAARFCEAHGYGLEVVPMNFAALISAVQSGKCDFAASGLFITPERQEQVLFAYPNTKSGNVIVVRKPGTKPQPSGEFAGLTGKRIGVRTGSNSDLVAAQFITDAKLEYFDTVTDIITALKQGKIDAMCTGIPLARYMLLEHKDLEILGGPLTDLDNAPIFAKTPAGEKLCAQFSEFINAQRANGTLAALDAIWFSTDESKQTIKDYTKFPAPRGTLKMAADPATVPFVFMRNGKFVGYDVDMTVRFCEAYGYGLEIVPMNYAAIIPAVQSGKCDFAACSIAITPERAEQVLFATPNAKGGNCIVVRKSAPQPARTPQAAPAAPAMTKPRTPTTQTAQRTPAAPSKPSTPATPTFLDELAASFNRTFIREDRWRLFVEGIINTMIITVLSILCGTILGFVVYLACRGGNVFANLITRFFVWLIQGTPMVVLLMILYYIIFGKVDIEGIWVAVIAFSMTFGAGVYGMLLSGTGALDRGQTEAAYALGFTDRRAFFTIILPQAALHFMPAYKAEVVALIKATAIVGYIAVQDLTKMGDIVRSRTYEAFFPLIAVAAIYFVLAGILNIIVGIIHNRIRPEKRTRDDILRGIDTHD